MEKVIILTDFAKKNSLVKFCQKKKKCCKNLCFNLLVESLYMLLRGVFYHQLETSAPAALLKTAWLFGGLEAVSQPVLLCLQELTGPQHK